MYNQLTLELSSDCLESQVIYAGAYYNRGNSHRKLKQYQKAIEDYNRALAINPDYAYAYEKRGLAYYELGEREKAIADIEKATQLFCQQGDPRCQQMQEALRQLQSGEL